MIAYMLTWTTYGSWLQGDERGWVKDGKTLDPAESLKAVNRENMNFDAVKLNLYQRKIVADSILEKSKEIEHTIYALAVCSNHIHLVAENTDIEIGKVVSYYKNAAKIALKTNGFVGQLWTKGFDKRYCSNSFEINEKIEYVLGHISGVVYQKGCDVLSNA